MDDVLAVTALTNLLMAAECLCFAWMLARRPHVRFSAAWYWTGAMGWLGLAALMGAIDHGWFEARGLARYPIQRANWLVLGVMTFFMLMAAARQFFPPRAARLARWFGLAQLAAYTGAVLAFGDYLVVVLNYSPVILLWLVLHMAGLKRGTGSRAMVAGTLVLFAATAVQVTGIDALSPLDHNGLYHIVSMPGIAALYLGTRRLAADRAAAPC